MLVMPVRGTAPKPWLCGNPGSEPRAGKLPPPSLGPCSGFQFPEADPGLCRGGFWPSHAERPGRGTLHFDLQHCGPSRGPDNLQGWWEVQPGQDGSISASHTPQADRRPSLASPIWCWRTLSWGHTVRSISRQTPRAPGVQKRCTNHGLRVRKAPPRPPV